MTETWKTPDDEYGQKLQLIFARVLANLNDPVAALTSVEDILFYLYTNYDQARVDRLAAMAEELALEVERIDAKCDPEINGFIQRLPEIIFTPSQHNTNVGELLVWAREIIADRKRSLN